MTSAHRHRLAVLLLAPVLLGCGGPGADDTPDPSGAEMTRSATELEIVLTPDVGAPPVTVTLRCDPPGGDHPAAEAACAAVAALGPAGFAPVPADRMCGQVYGGPETARVTGTVAGEPVDALLLPHRRLPDRALGRPRPAARPGLTGRCKQTPPGAVPPERPPAPTQE